MQKIFWIYDKNVVFKANIVCLFDPLQSSRPSDKRVCYRLNWECGIKTKICIFHIGCYIHVTGNYEISRSHQLRWTYLDDESVILVIKLMPYDMYIAVMHLWERAICPICFAYLSYIWSYFIIHFVWCGSICNIDGQFQCFFCKIYWYLLRWVYYQMFVMWHLFSFLGFFACYYKTVSIQTWLICLWFPPHSRWLQTKE